MRACRHAHCPGPRTSTDRPQTLRAAPRRAVALCLPDRPVLRARLRIWRKQFHSLLPHRKQARVSTNTVCKGMRKHYSRTCACEFECGALLGPLNAEPAAEADTSQVPQAQQHVQDTASWLVMTFVAVAMITALVDFSRAMAARRSPSPSRFWSLALFGTKAFWEQGQERPRDCVRGRQVSWNSRSKRATNIS